MAKSQNRERARLRLQRFRDRQRARNREVAAAKAARQEEIGESLAPYVLRHPIIDAAGRMLVGPRVQVVEGRLERVLAIGVDSDPIAKLVRDSKSITERHKRAARQFQQDWQDVGEGVNAPAVDYLRSGGGGGDGLGGHLAMLSQVETRRRLEGAAGHLGAFLTSVVRIVVHCVPLGIWAIEADLQPGEALEWIALALDRLAGFYWPARTDVGTPSHPLTIGPSRKEYSMEVAENG